jgi:hypothetical protein
VIRKAILELLKRSDNKQPLPPPPPDEIRHPTAENFGIRWKEMQKSLFNCLAARVVLEHVCENWEGNKLTESKIAELPVQISEHIRYLCRCWKSAQWDDAETLKKTELKKASAASRRATVSSTFKLCFIRRLILSHCCSSTRAG